MLTKYGLPLSIMAFAIVVIVAGIERNDIVLICIHILMLFMVMAILREIGVKRD